MSHSNLIQLVETTDFLRPDQKERILKLLPRLSEEDSAQLAAVLVQGASSLSEIKSSNLEQATRLTQLFTAMNKHALKQSKKETFEFIELDEKSEGNLDQILNQLTHD